MEQNDKHLELYFSKIMFVFNQYLHPILLSYAVSIQLKPYLQGNLLGPTCFISLHHVDLYFF